MLSMCMGGVSSQALVDAVNLAYDDGLVLVTAAGNNFAGTALAEDHRVPRPLRRVLAACGVMADGRAYAGLAFRTMQGNYGPPEQDGDGDRRLHARTCPGPQIGCAKVVDMDGAGTSAATPQVAAAAALWLAEHWDAVKGYPRPGRASRRCAARCSRAPRKSTASMDAAETREKLGQGVMQGRRRPRRGARRRRRPRAAAAGANRAGRGSTCSSAAASAWRAADEARRHVRASS